MSTSHSFELTRVDMERVVYMQHASLPPDFDALYDVRFERVVARTRELAGRKEAAGAEELIRWVKGDGA
jgi:hypothetical protein